MALRLFFNPRIAFCKLCSDEFLNKSLSPRKLNAQSLLWMSTERATHKPNTIDKYLLVWMKKYPSVAEVPNYVNPVLMEKVRNKSRIKITIIFCFLTAIICVVMVYQGKKAAERGESIRKMNLQWHEEQNAKK